MAFPLDGDLTLDDIETMTTEEINDNWLRVSEAMSANRRDIDLENEDEAPQGEWQSPPLGRLTRDDLARMTPAEVNARWNEVQQVLAR